MSVKMYTRAYLKNCTEIENRCDFLYFDLSGREWNIFVKKKAKYAVTVKKADQGFQEKFAVILIWDLLQHFFFFFNLQFYHCMF